MIDKICIIGVGLIGGSLALGLKKANQVKTVVGFSRNEANLKTAQALGVIDEYSLDIVEALDGVQMVVIATPVDSFKLVLSLIKPYIGEHITIFDVGSTKGSVVQIAKHVFGEMPTRFIPVHPIAGKEKNGVEVADATLFNNKRVVLTPEHNANKQAIVEVSELWQSLGAQVEVMSHTMHDNLLAMTSHLPHMLAFSLMDYLINNNPNACDYAASGFKDFSRIASSDAIMWRDICINNPEQIVKHIEGYQQRLAKLSTLIKNQDRLALERLFLQAKNARDKLYE